MTRFMEQELQAGWTETNCVRCAEWTRPPSYKQRSSLLPGNCFHWTKISTVPNFGGLGTESGTMDLLTGLLPTGPGPPLVLGAFQPTPLGTTVLRTSILPSKVKVPCTYLLVRSTECEYV